jgi:hypothetical protein
MRTFFFMLLVGTLGFSSCNTNNSNNSNTNNGNANNRASTTNTNTMFVEPRPPIKTSVNPDPNFKSCNPYYPLKPGSQAEYTLQYSSPLVADVRVIVDQKEENGRNVFVETTQIIDKSGGLNKDELTERKYLCDNGRIQIISEKVDNRTEKGASIVETVFRDATNYMVDPTSLLRKGTTWSYSFTQKFQLGSDPPVLTEPTTISFESQGEEDVKVPAGTFKAVKITRKIKNTVVNDFYVAGIGLVKRANNEGTTWELKSFSGLQEITR